MVLRRPSHCPTEVHPDQDYLEAVPALIGGRKWVLVTSAGWAGRGAIKAITGAAGAPQAIVDDVPENPTISYVETLTSVKTADLVVAIGGGSVMDAAKGLAALQALGGDIPRFEAHLRDGEPLPEDLDPAPLICVPTTSGTGSEVTRWATIWGDEKVKLSLTDPRLYPSDAVLDPSLCISMPRERTLAGGLDALSHAMEAVWNNNHTPESDRWATTAIGSIRSHLSAALERPDDIEARREMQAAATTAGFAMGTTQTALAHSISYPFTALFGMPHGLACSFTLPAVAEYNMAEDESRFGAIAEGLECEIADIPAVLLAWFDEMRLGAAVGRYITAADIDGLGENLITRARAANNLRAVDGATAKDIAKRSLGDLSGAAAVAGADTAAAAP